MLENFCANVLEHYDQFENENGCSNNNLEKKSPWRKLTSFVLTLDALRVANMHCWENWLVWNNLDSYNISILEMSYKNTVLRELIRRFLV